MGKWEVREGVREGMERMGEGRELGKNRKGGGSIPHSYF